VEAGPFEIVDVTNREQLAEVVTKYRINTIIHLAAILSAVGEANPHLAWDVNINGLYNVLEVARHEICSVFYPQAPSRPLAIPHPKTTHLKIPFSGPPPSTA